MYLYVYIYRYIHIYIYVYTNTPLILYGYVIPILHMTHMKVPTVT